MNLLAPLAHLFRTPAERERAATLKELEVKLRQATRRLQESYDYADRLVSDWERERDELLYGSGLAGRRNARKDGDQWPFLRNMEDLNRYRALSREAVDGNGYGAGMLDRAIDFVVGDGMQPEITLRGARKGAVATGVADADGDGRPDADPAVEAVQGVIDDFRRLNDWGMGEEDREEEGFRRSQRDGEVFVRFFDGSADSNGIPLVRWIEPEQVDAAPGDPEYRWGIRYKTGDVESREAVYVYDPDGTGGEWVPFAEVVFHKLGTDRTVLRGMPQFWLVALALQQCDKLNSAVAEVSAIQAQIAYVREHTPGLMPGQIQEFVGSTGDGLGKKVTPYGDKYRRVGYGENGTVVDMSAGMKFTAGPVTTGVPGFVQALQSRLRQVCARFGYPEFFTGDASNGNYASLLAAGGPAERAFKRRQQKYAAFQAAVYRKACEYAVRAQRLSQSDLAAVEIKVKPGKVSVSNNLEDAQIDQILVQNKVKSVQTVMAERGLDPRVETANIKAFDDQFGMGAMGMGGGGFGGGDGSQLLDPTGESYTAGEYEVLSEADRAGLVKKTGTDARGRKYTRWVRAQVPKQDKAKAAAEAKAAATDLIERGVRTPAEAKALAGHLSRLTVKDIEALKAAHAAKVGGRLKQDKVDRLVAFAQGRGSVPAGAATNPDKHAAAGKSLVGRAAAGVEEAPPKERAGQSLEGRVRAAAIKLGRGQEGRRVLLKDLRKELPDVPPAELDDAIRGMSRAGHLSLYPLDDPRQIKDEDRAAAILSGSGVQQHLLYLGGISGSKPGGDVPDVVLSPVSQQFHDGEGGLDLGAADDTSTARPDVPAQSARPVPPRAELESSIMGEIERGLAGEFATIRMVPIHTIRDAIRAKYGDAAASPAVFNETLLDMRQAKKVRFIPISDLSQATPDQLGKSLPSSVGTLFYVERV